MNIPTDQIQKYQYKLLSVSLTPFINDNVKDTIDNYKIFPICFLEKDQCKSDLDYIMVVAFVPLQFYQDNFLEKQFLQKEVLIFDR